MKKRLPLLTSTAIILVLAAIVVPHKRNPYTSRNDTRTVQLSPRLYGLYGDYLGEEAFDSMGGAPSNSIGGGVRVDPIDRGVYQVTLQYTGTDWEEKFILAVPPGPYQIAPVLVLFHAYGENPEDLLDNTEYFTKAAERGWYVVAPLGAHQYNFGIDYAQDNIEAALNWVARALPIDVSRLYGLGFSMGGGAATSYAARHQDFLGGRFAAIVNHTGSTSLSHSYHQSPDPRLFLSPLMFGASPEDVPFAYSASSAFDLDPDSNTVDQSSDMLRNLVGTPVRTFASINDPVTTLVAQTEAFDTALIARGGEVSALRSTILIHEWTTMDPGSALDWLGTHQLQELPPFTTRNLLADRDGRWHGLGVTQRSEGSFTPITYQVQPGPNRLYTIATSNLAKLVVRPSAIGLNTSEEFTWIIGNSDGAPVRLILTGVTHSPSDITRNGTGSTEWYYDPARSMIVIDEPNAAAVPQWKIHF